MSKIALNMIVKDDTEAMILDRCLKSVAPYVDGIFIVATNTPYDKVGEVVKRYGGEIFFYKWDNDFARARNYAMSQIPKEYEYMVWTDADDIWRNADKIPMLVEVMEKEGYDATYLKYNYEIAKNGRVDMHHMRERIIKLSFGWHWVADIHEVLIQKEGTPKATAYQGVWVDHYPLEQHKTDRLYRNLKMLEDKYKKEGEEHDPRTEFYLARNLYDVGEYDRALKLFEDYEKHSGWDEEIALSCNYRGSIYMMKGDVDMAIKVFLEAIHNKPLFPSFYINLAVCYATLQKYDEAVHYARLFSNIPTPKTTTVLIPAEDEAKYYQVLFQVAVAKGKLNEAVEVAKILSERFPEVESNKERYLSMQEIKRNTDFSLNIVKLVEELIALKEMDKVDLLLDALPSNIINNPIISRLRLQYSKPKKWGKKTIVYYTGATYEEWSPKSLKTGIGGSETAVIRLSEEWAKLGYKVVVYGNCGEGAGIYNGVKYEPYWKFNPNDSFNTLILWRDISALDYDIKAKKIVVDLHDVPNGADYTEKRLEKIDRIFVKSKYHRSLLPNVKENKFLIRPNGYSPELLESCEGLKRDPYRIIYKSSYDRGLEAMLQVWHIIKKNVPEAKLDIYYGWNLFDTVNANNAERKAWKARMLELMNQEGITEHGRIGQEQLMQETAKSSIHWYGCTFEEIDCISVRESAVVGTLPVTTDYAALEEKEYCSRIEGDPYEKETHEEIANTIVTYLKDPKALNEASKNIKNIAQKESWSVIAKKWAEYL